MNTISKYQIIDHGVENSQYFQGCGVAHTEFGACYTGIGNSAHEALDDALEQAAMDNWNTEPIDNTLSEVATVNEDDDETYHYVSIKVKGV